MRPVKKQGKHLINHYKAYKNCIIKLQTNDLFKFLTNLNFYKYNFPSLNIYFVSLYAPNSYYSIGSSRQTFLIYNKDFNKVLNFLIYFIQIKCCKYLILLILLFYLKG